MNDLPHAVKIQPNDILTGQTYLKLLNAYKEYDRKQKEVIYQQQKRIEMLEWHVNDLQLALDEISSGSDIKLRKKLKNQHESINNYLKAIRRYKDTIAELTEENERLAQTLANCRKQSEQ